MAGGILKAIGIVLVVLGVLGLVGAALFAGFSVPPQSTEGQLLESPRDRESRRGAMQAAPMLGVGGMAFIVVGAVLFAVGGWVSRRADREERRREVAMAAMAARASPPAGAPSPPSLPVAAPPLVIPAVACPRCNGPNPFGIRFCGSCGARLA